MESGVTKKTYATPVLSIEGDAKDLVRMPPPNHGILSQII